MNVLIIDDERTILKTVYSQLSRMQLGGVEEIDIAESAAQARECMSRRHYDIFLCDIVMPKEDGITFARWILERDPEVKIIFLTAYADVNYMKEAIAMQSFDYVFQPASLEELRSVVERAVSQIKIEKKNRVLMNRGAFFQSHEENILEVGALQYLDGRNTDNSYLRRMIALHNIYPAGVSVYLPVLVQILKTQKRLQEIEKPLLRLIYQNILDEVFQALKVYSIILLEEEGTDFTVLLYWDKEAPHTREIIAESLENFRILLFRVMQTTAAVYCGEAGGPEKLLRCAELLLQAKTDNVRQESRVFCPKKDEEDVENRSYRLQLGAWKRLLEQNRFLPFRDSVLCYIGGDSRRHMNASDMMNLHQSVTQLLLSYLVERQIGSDLVFDEDLPYLTYMSAWQSLELFEKALSHIAGRLQELEAKEESRDVIRETMKYIRQRLDTDLSVSEIAEFAGMNPEYLTKLFKKNTGYTLKEYIIKEKMESAKMLLATTSLPVTLISSHVGYGNYSNFTRSFKQLEGCTPMEYRKGAVGERNTDRRLSER
ncbi:MAG: response regulator [Roseburia sp.]|nr:response regulator [Roseburia sp.]MCM1096788.1 response regulator [Ruminococcus flavefaciens]